MFRNANPNSRIPAVLQANTKENLIFQLSLVGVMLVGFYVKDKLDTRRDEKAWQINATPVD